MTKLFGQVYNIQHFSVHDGPGIRTLIFMKGCPLRCTWCSNPESQSPNSQVAINSNRCIGIAVCGYCLAPCDQGALSSSADGKIIIDNQLCNNCQKCAKVCVANSIHVFGRDMTVEAICEETQKYNRAWRANGGITISGGEPLLQSEFVIELLKRFKAIGTHTAIETSGYAQWEKLKEVAAWCDTIFYDIKLMDGERHKEFTGVDNKIILENLSLLSSNSPHTQLIVRTPVVPGISDAKENILAITHFLKTLPHLSDYELLPYHGYGQSKYEQLGKTYELKDLKVPNRQHIKQLNNEVRSILNITNWMEAN